MDELFKLKEMLCRELEKYGSKGELTGGTLEVVDKLAHALKNIDRIIETKESAENGSYADAQGMSGRSYTGMGNRRGSYGSYARGRGRNARRDSMGRYSSVGYSRGEDSGEYVEQLQEMMQELPQEAQKHIQKAIQEIEQM